MFRRALNTSLWEIWMATVLFLTEKLMRMKVKTNTMAVRMNRHLPPEQSLTASSPA